MGGITKSDANQRWAAIADHLVAVKGEKKRFVLEDDLDALLQPPPAEGVRVLPAKDVFLQARDRDLLIPDPVHRKAVFPNIGGPGVVLHEALPVATWRGAAKGKRYEIRVAPFATVTKATWADIEAEADRIARARGHDQASVVRGD